MPKSKAKQILDARIPDAKVLYVSKGLYSRGKDELRKINAPVAIHEALRGQQFAWGTIPLEESGRLRSPV